MKVPADVPQPYAVYGHFYDVTQGPADGAKYLALLRRHHPSARTLLELGCGTGAHLAALAEHYDVEGLDVSRTMLHYARKRLPGIRLHRQSMAGFTVPRRFDAVVCPFDSVNHLLSFADWVKTFRAAKRHLNPQGVFVFDANTPFRLRELAAAPPWVHRFGENYLIMTVSLERAVLSRWDIEIFERRRGSGYRLHREVLRESAFEHVRVKDTLERIFGSVRPYDHARWSRPKKSSRRLFYVCQ
jgi:SAM-dependent methyltransferase